MKLAIIDANAVIHRAFHALPPLESKNGEQTGAVYGFLLFFFKAVKEFNPDFILAAFDYPAPTFRHKEYKGYKATRQKAPDELYSQIPKVKDFLNAFSVFVFEKEGYEADDIIGTAAEKFSKDAEVIILTGDMDALQLVKDNVKVYLLKRGIKDALIYGRKEVSERYSGLNPENLIDFKSLRGDPSDNIPGVRGIGEKAASKIIKDFGSLEAAYKNLDKVSPSLRKKLESGKEDAFMSKMLVEIEKSVPFDFGLKDLAWKGYNSKKGLEMLEEYNFKSLIKRLGKRETNLKLL
ncbi:MAG: hypothetical protein A2365_00125 [Candidatus Nealsonbacteria bacterium RIFOXYB1_FULL_40_15]|uniref:5'-3' exonuclease domain-containing protein n=2 Tax=Candidatus Nealsoniibacteriota TaxID=1817911 RepID=A0A1G2EUX2_9BACT|nr:MAG: hypothetical protein A2365_00125 [Candidatus Nealsonbacteria bacterium RIFOXYB1_FULL_40_15]OGZ29160.1 MAG: hypothetical protein A2427_03690 [Candidatus Nealsonbacteria bacterium RIFOXYC1_FULL_40_7]OGZ29712.1 MAG: hypothetical protein A2562_04580 [Candidatus Nealsonbacteria bacterium RIFOXYD1_FULL_39_11]